MSKAPVSVIQELCVKKRTGAPFYDLIEDGSDPETKMFAYSVELFGQTAKGKGKSKKDAKHEAAVNMINILKEIDEFKADLKGVPSENPLPRLQTGDGDAVRTLLDICVQRDWPIAQFTVQQAFGAPHSPEFTVECRLASMVRVGTFSTKKGAKQIAAQEMLNVIQKLPVGENQLQVATLTDEGPEQHVQTYRELKNSDIKAFPGTKLCDRHKFFQKLSNEQKEKMRSVLFDINETPREKLHLLCSTMKWKYTVNPVLNHPEGNIKIFELQGINYDVVKSGTEDELYAELLDYFKCMSGVVNNRNLYIEDI